MSVAVVFPWRAGDPYREESFEWVKKRYSLIYPNWEQVTGDSSDGPFNRSEAILNGASKTNAGTLVIADSDVWCAANLKTAVRDAYLFGWSVPHHLIHRLSEASSASVLAGDDWRGLPLSEDNKQDFRPYRGHATGTLLVLSRATLETVPPDVRFVGWGSEDDAWNAALRTLVGPPRRGSADLVHLWHPSQPRQSRITGNPESAALLRRYLQADGRAPEMRRLLDETAGAVKGSPGIIATTRSPEFGSLDKETTR